MTVAPPHRLPVPPPPRTAGAAVQRALYVVGILSWLLIVPTGLVPLAQQDWAINGRVMPGLLLLFGHQAVVLVSLVLLVVAPAATRRWRGWFTGVGLWGSGALLGLSLVLMALHRHQVPSDFWSPGYWMLPWFAWLCPVVERRAYLRATWVLLAVVMLGDRAVQVALGIPFHAVDLAIVVWTAPPVYLLVLFADVLLTAARAAEAQAARRDEAQRRQEGARTLARARREAARILHDHVLHALHAISLPPGRVSAALVRQECQEAVDAVDGHHDDRPTERLEEVIATDPVLQRIGATLEGSTAPAPTGVVQAMAAAVHEALGNVERHATADHCRVVVEQGSDGWRVEVADDGRGFDPQRVDRRRLGLRRSLLERMDDVGGRADIESAAGQGTRVVLQWPAPGVRHGLDGGFGEASLRRGLALTAVPGIVNAAFMTLLLGPLLPRPALAVSVALVALVLAGLAAWRLRHATLSWRQQAVVVAGAEAALLVNLWLYPTGGNVYLLWMGWGSSGIIHLLVMQLRARRGLLLVAGWLAAMAVALVWRFGWGVDWLREGSTLVASGGELLISVAGLVLARYLVGAAEAQAELAQHVQRATARLRMSTQYEDYWSVSVVDDALPLLRRVARLGVGTVTAESAVHARLLEARLREELVLGRHHAELLSAVTELRRQGWQVTVSLHDDHAQDPLAALAGLLRQLGPAARQGQQLTVTSTRPHGTAVVISPTDEQALSWGSSATLRRAGATVDADEDFARLQVPLAAPRVLL